MCLLIHPLEVLCFVHLMVRAWIARLLLCWSLLPSSLPRRWGGGGGGAEERGVCVCVFFDARFACTPDKPAHAIV